MFGRERVFAREGVGMLEQISDALEREGTTRRQVIRTGVKIAYAAPVVAATMRLGSQGARAAVASFECPPNLICGVLPQQCGEDETGICSSVRSVEANSCICGNDACGPVCNSDAECQSYAPGAICQAPGTGCCGQKCIAPCHGFDGTAVGDGLTSNTRP
jgi:hypothetical protein